MDNPYSAGLEIVKNKIAQTQEAEISVKLKGKHISLLRRLLFQERLNNLTDEIREVENILYKAYQLL